MKDIGDAVLGGQHVMFERIQASQTWDFHDAESHAEFQREMRGFMTEVRTFIDHSMSELQSIKERLDRLQR